MFVAHEDDRRFSEADEESLVILAEWAAHAIDNAQLYETSERRRTELERGVLVLEVTRDLLLSIGASTQLNRVLELIAKRGRALIAARSIVIMLREDDELVVAASAGPTIDIGVLSREHAADVSTEQAPATHELLVSMLHAGEPVGMLAAARGADSDGFTEEDEQLLALFAATAATAVAIAQTAEADRVKSSLLIADAERRRWARELHDETLQGLGALRLMVARTVRRDEGDAAIEADVDEALNAIDSEIQNLRAIISDLRPAALDDLGLLPALETLLERRARDGLEIMHELTLPALDTGDERLDAELENTIYRIVQEGLTNIVKHAGANTVRLTIDSSPEAVRIELADDGVGFNPQIRASGFGLEGIRERVNLIGGTLEIESGSSGTLLRVRLRAASPAAEDG
jgi:signal transduction histidine kinase